MRKILFGAIALVAAFSAAPASAADLSRNSTPYMTAPTNYGPYRWTGPYVGANLGYEWGTVTHLPGNPSGFAGGVQGGYNWQNGQFVYGVETDLQLSGADDTFAPFKFSNTWFGTARGRGGIAFSNVLLYLTAGLAYGGGKLETGGLSETQTHFGWTGGGGIEVGLTPNWSAKAEYLWLDLGERTYNLSRTNSGIEASVLRFGANYRF